MEKIKKGSVDRQRQMPPFGISTKLQRGASLKPSQSFRQMKGGRTPQCQNGPVLFPYSTPRSPATTGNQTISRREIKGPILPSGSRKHGNDVR